MTSESSSGHDRELMQQEIAALRDRADQLERELAQNTAGPVVPPGTYYAAYYATTGFMLGMFGAATSLVCNIIGSLVWTNLTGQNQNPLRLIQVYLTFPLGAQALQIEGGLTLAIGCCLYLATGMLYGIVFHLVLTRLTAGSTFQTRLLVVSVLSIVVWLVNFYGILSWLQPLLFGGRWIVELVPWWVAGLTHLVFGWTMVFVYPWGLYTPYQVETESV